MTHEELKERLWAEVMEDYVITAELGHLAKDQVVHKAEMRAHLDKLVDWLTTYRAQVLEEETKRCAEVFTDNILDVRDENGEFVPREIKLNAVLEALKHPTN